MITIKSHSGVTNPEERLRPCKAIDFRMTKIDTRRFSVTTTSKSCHHYQSDADRPIFPRIVGSNISRLEELWYHAIVLPSFKNIGFQLSLKQMEIVVRQPSIIRLFNDNVVSIVLFPLFILFSQH
jgi:hypothetical protein